MRARRLLLHLLLLDAYEDKLPGITMSKGMLRRQAWYISVLYERLCLSCVIRQG